MSCIVIEIFFLSRPNSSIDEVKKKWVGVRQYYMNEKKKVENSAKSGAGRDAVSNKSF